MTTVSNSNGSSAFNRPVTTQINQERRVVVTGIGVISPLGQNLDVSWKNAVAGVSGIDFITLFDTTGFDVRFAGEVKNFDPNVYIEKKEQKKMDRFIHLALGASEMALKDSGLEITEELAPRIGTIIGAGMGGLGGIETQHKALTERGPSRVSPFFIPMVISNLAAGQVSIKFGLKGVNYAVTSACASGAHSIGEATSYIRRGVCDVMVAGGTEAAITPLAVAGFTSMRALSSRNEQPKAASRPFDRDRDGFVIAEGAAILILEDYEHATKRGARIYAEVGGYGASSDGFHMTTPAPGGTGGAAAMTAALDDARLNPEQIQYINAHGTSTPVGDEIEVQAIKSVFKNHSKNLWVSSTKSMTGHTLGAAGALESAFCILALKEGVVPPTINLENPGDGCDLDFVPGVSRDCKLSHVVNNSFGFGGTNASLIFSKI
jgi:3-oxoacyl-[acyl-carrier-protein] synthase II